jgi:hypothetical protein
VRRDAATAFGAVHDQVGSFQRNWRLCSVLRVNDTTFDQGCGRGKAAISTFALT